MFDGLSCLPGSYSIKHAEPVVQPARRVPFKYREQLQAQLTEMVQDDIIEWVSPIVLVTKPGSQKLRICTELNRAIRRKHYQIKIAEEIFQCLSGVQCFTTLDAISGFLQVALDTKSSYLTTFATPFGFLRLPFGISSAPEVFHRIVTESFADIPGAHTYIDILVTGSTVEEHDSRLRMVLERCHKINLNNNIQS